MHLARKNLASGRWVQEWSAEGGMRRCRHGAGTRSRAIDSGITRTQLSTKKNKLAPTAERTLLKCAHSGTRSLSVDGSRKVEVFMADQKASATKFVVQTNNR